MLIAQGGLLPPRAQPRAVRQIVAGALSVVVHGAVLFFLLARPGRDLPPPAPPLEIEMVQQQAEIRGAPPPPPPAPPPTPSAPDASASAPSLPSPAAPSAPQAPASAAPTPAAPATAPARPPQQAAPEVNLGDSMRDVDPLTVTGKNVVPAAPDQRYRNLPPHYPAAAAKIGAEGTVQLVAHIAATGQAVSVGIVTSSGNADLDEEARRAVMLWRFRPARDGSRAVPFDYVIDIRFALGNR